MEEIPIKSRQHFSYLQYPLCVLYILITSSFLYNTVNFYLFRLSIRFLFSYGRFHP